MATRDEPAKVTRDLANGPGGLEVMRRKDKGRSTTIGQSLVASGLAGPAAGAFDYDRLLWGLPNGLQNPDGRPGMTFYMLADPAEKREGTEVRAVFANVRKHFGERAAFMTIAANACSSLILEKVSDVQIAVVNEAWAKAASAEAKPIP